MADRARRRGRVWAAGSAIALLLLLAAAPARAAAPIEGLWRSGERVVRVDATGPSTFVGAAAQSYIGFSGCPVAAGTQTWELSGSGLEYRGTVPWYNTATCATTGQGETVWSVDKASGARTARLCTREPGQGPPTVDPSGNPTNGTLCFDYTTGSEQAVACDAGQVPWPVSGPVPAYSERKVGHAVAAGCFEETGPGVYSTNLPARVGGFTVTPRDRSARLVVDTGKGALRAEGDVVASLDSQLPSSASGFDPAALPTRAPSGSMSSRAAGLSVAGIPLGIRPTIKWSGDGQGATVSGGVAWTNLPKKLSRYLARGVGLKKLPTLDGSLSLSLDNANGVDVQSAKLALGDLSLVTPFRPLKLKAISATLERPVEGTLRWKLDGNFETPLGCVKRPQDEEVSCLEIRGAMYWTADGPAGAGLGVNNLDVPIGATPFKLQGLSGDVVWRPEFGLSLTGSGTFGGKIRGEDRGTAIELSATLALLALATGGDDPCAATLKLSGDGTWPVLKRAGGEATLGLKLCADVPAGRTLINEVRGSFRVVLPGDLASFDATAGGWWGEERFSFDGSAAAFIRGRSLNGGAFVVSDKAIAVCGRVLWVAVGAVWEWRGLGDAFSHCDLGPWKSERARTSQVGATSFTARRGQRLVGVRLVGPQRAPRVRLVGPGGVVVDGSAGAATADRIVDVDDVRRITTVLLRKPRAGRWRVEPIAPTETIAGMQTAVGKPALRLRARVSGRGARRTLRWRLRPRAGERIRFVDRTRGGARTLVTTRRASGRTRFRPVRGRSRAHRIEAVVIDEGTPVMTRRLARFRAPGPRPVPRPRSVRLRRTKSGLSVRWSGARLQALVVVRHGAFGGQAFVGARRRRLAIPAIRRSEAVRVTVAFYDAAGRRGRPVARRLRAGRARAGAALIAQRSPREGTHPK